MGLAESGAAGGQAGPGHSNQVLMAMGYCQHRLRFHLLPLGLRWRVHLPVETCKGYEGKAAVLWHGCVIRCLSGESDGFEIWCVLRTWIPFPAPSSFGALHCRLWRWTRIRKEALPSSQAAFSWHALLIFACCHRSSTPIPPTCGRVEGPWLVLSPVIRMLTLEQHRKDLHSPEQG